MPRTITSAALSLRRLPNVWDIAALLCVVGVIVAVGSAARGSLVPLQALEATPIDLDPGVLPGYALRTTVRMFIALFFSVVFTFLFAPLAAKSRRAERIMIPVLDILQSVPILGFLSFTVIFFMSLFPGRVLGLELAAIFAIFTSQAWNMAFSFYQSLTTVPPDLDEATRMYRLTAWQRFWRLEVPFAMPGLVWNAMLSMSAGWFFVVASEAITLGNQTWKLPGIGSYVAAALEQRDIGAVFWAIAAMLVVILVYDQLLFRPLTAWSAKFRVETIAGATAGDPWPLKLARRTTVLRLASEALGTLFGMVTGLRLGRPPAAASRAAPARLGDAVFAGVVGLAVALAVAKVAAYVAAELSWGDLLETLLLGCLTLLRVMVMMVLASVIWVPVGVWLGLRPAWARRAQPLAQFLAAFPANLLFPPFVLIIVHFDLNVDVFLTPLMVLGTQWYILFNVVAGAAAFPGDLQEAASNLRIGGWLWWRRVMLPGIMPYYVTGAIAASGGSWNAAIVAEVASWGDTKLAAHGLGAYIAAATDAGDFHRIVLGVVVMSLFVVLFNRFFWRPLHAYASRRALG
ncbi:ABC transporter permease subunit [Rhodovastum atsumiense]|uniref:ABC transporter permease subunit n=1 Tax=Rhodovastum atsumiense TaxID=504468 RepID=A0A5M6IRU5_9PROT|nr:ABC transporter permease subunit [Rhodovastum atsumiense]KAA5611030.1 ABC transporter permease subunit [Rhodovastum atsumiense]CAH2600184.1 ABC transporter permease subunit [Rhodovastum atsumiense]